MGPPLWQWDAQPCPRLRLGGAERKAPQSRLCHGGCELRPTSQVLVRARLRALRLSARPNLHRLARQELGVQGALRYPAPWVTPMPALWFGAPFCHSAPIFPSAAPPGTRVCGSLVIGLPGTHHSTRRTLKVRAPALVTASEGKPRATSLGPSRRRRCLPQGPRRQGVGCRPNLRPGQSHPTTHVNEVPFKSGLEVGQHSGLLEVSGKAGRRQSGSTSLQCRALARKSSL